MGLTPEYEPQESELQNRGDDSNVTKSNRAIPNPVVPSSQLIGILSQISGIDPSLIKSNSRLIEDIGIDALGYYEILIEAQEHLDVKIQEEDLLNFRTVEDIDNHLRTLTLLDDQTS